MNKKSTPSFPRCIDKKMVAPKVETILFLKQLARLAQKRSTDISTILIH